MFTLNIIQKYQSCMAESLKVVIAFDLSKQNLISRAVSTLVLGRSKQFAPRVLVVDEKEIHPSDFKCTLVQDPSAAAAARLQRAVGNDLSCC